MKINATAALCGLVMASAAGAATAQPVELDPMTVRGERLELALRAIQVGLDNPRSTRAGDADELVCWFASKTGSRLRHLFCATNGALNESSDHVQRALLGMAGGRNGKARNEIFVSHVPVNRAALRATLARLGPTAMSRDIVKRARRGGGVPRNLPGRDELERYIEARRLLAADSVESGRAIREAGLTPARYREITDLTGELPGLAEYIGERL